ncbi:hypothetical protein EYF80_014289 [Liparis tanakae]|uniref:Uncharacterized protein n=1 Tax=Liparis tanakae TaxID=230148 RepID=A0A4Z2IBX0_9TELE|nr:hypothetical protein EYF80_014289 [Liparis tanakae]
MQEKKRHGEGREDRSLGWMGSLMCSTSAITGCKKLWLGIIHNKGIWASLNRVHFGMAFVLRSEMH